MRVVHHNSRALDSALVRAQRHNDARTRTLRLDPDFYRDMDQRAEAELKSMPQRRIAIRFPSGNIVLV